MCQAFSIINFSLFLYKIRLSLWKGILNRDGQQFQQYQQNKQLLCIICTCRNFLHTMYMDQVIIYGWVYIKHSPILLLQVFIPVDSLPQQFILWIIMCIALHL